jgi:hypothetical protein
MRPDPPGALAAVFVLALVLAAVLYLLVGLGVVGASDRPAAPLLLVSAATGVLALALRRRPGGSPR